MNSLAVKLMGAFVAVVLVGVAVVTILANRATTAEFEHFMFQGQMVAAQDMVSSLADDYAHNGSWAGAQQLLAGNGRGNRGGLMGGGIGMDYMMMGSSRLLVVDARSRRVVADSIRTDIGRAVSDREWADGLPIRVAGETVGALLVQDVGMMSPQTSQLETEFLARVNRAIFLAALAAGVVALVLGALLVRQITAPLGKLTQAAGQVAAGDLEARVETTGSDEFGRVGTAFNQMAASLSHQEQLRRNLMADIAHELRTPISVIQGQVEALQDGVFPLNPEALEPLHSNALLLNRLVEDLRTLAHAEAGQIDLDRRPVALTELVADLLVSLRAEAEAAGVTLRADVPANLPLADADPQRLRQILLNLLSNALRHTPAGGEVRIQSSAATHRFDSDNRLPADGWLLTTVTDTGPGIPAEDLLHIFDRFYRGDKSRSRKSGGTGLGLTIARQLVEAHGGRIWAENVGPGRGAAFHVVLPAAKQSAPMEK